MVMPAGLQPIADLSQTDAMIVEGGEHLWGTVIALVVHYLALALVEVMHVAAGFGVYLSRRAELEGWDIEIAFRAVASRQRSQQRERLGFVDDATRGAARPRRRAATSLVVVLGSVLATAMIAAAPAHATPEGSGPWPRWSTLERSESRCEGVLDTVRANPAFGTVKKRTVWRWVDSEPADDTEEEATDSGISLLAGLGTLPGLLAIGIVLGGIVALAVAGLQLLAVRSSAVSSVPEPASDAGGAEEAEPETPIERPADPVAEVQRLWHRRAFREALALCVWVGRETWQKELSLQLRRGATEAEWLRAVTRRAGAVRSAPFGRLVRSWQQVAYAHREPPDDALEAVVADLRQTLHGAEPPAADPREART
jgi:hypothetical protein